MARLTLKKLPASLEGFSEVVKDLAQLASRSWSSPCSTSAELNDKLETLELFFEALNILLKIKILLI